MTSEIKWQLWKRLWSFVTNLEMGKDDWVDSTSISKGSSDYFGFRFSISSNVVLGVCWMLSFSLLVFVWYFLWFLLSFSLTLIICCSYGIDFWLFCFLILSYDFLLIMFHFLVIALFYASCKCCKLSFLMLYEWFLWIILKIIYELKGLFLTFFWISIFEIFGLFNLISYYSLLCIAFLLILYHSKLVYLSYLRNCSQNWNSCIFVLPGFYIYIYIYIIYILYIIF